MNALWFFIFSVPGNYNSSSGVALNVGLGTLGEVGELDEIPDM